MGFTVPALYTLCKSFLEAQRIQCGCCAAQIPPGCITRLQSRGRGYERTCNGFFCPAGVPAMFVTVWATVRAIFADTEWVCINHTHIVISQEQHAKVWSQECRRGNDVFLHFYHRALMERLFLKASFAKFSIFQEQQSRDLTTHIIKCYIWGCNELDILQPSLFPFPSVIFDAD